jgi:hypothetical protein
MMLLDINPGASAKTTAAGATGATAGTVGTVGATTGITGAPAPPGGADIVVLEVLWWLDLVLS